MRAPTQPTVGSIAIVLRGDEALLVKRKFAPDAGLWGFPGGKMEVGETFFDCAIRELHEETGLIAIPVARLTLLEIIRKHSDGTIKQHTLLAAILCEYVSGTAVAADDAEEVAWVSDAEMDRRSLSLVQDVSNVMKLAAKYESLGDLSNNP